MAGEPTADPVVLENYEQGEFEILPDQFTSVVPEAEFLPNMKKWVKSTKTIPTRDRAVLHMGDCDIYPLPTDEEADEDASGSEDDSEPESRSHSRSAEPVQRLMGKELSEPPHLCELTVTAAAEVTAEKPTGQEVTPNGGPTASLCESRRAATVRKKVEVVVDDPTVQQAMRGTHREQWITAMLDELTSLREHDVFELVECH
eukprot:jgi/Ulvmu1/9769/UM056_0009.1